MVHSEKGRFEYNVNGTASFADLRAVEGLFSS